MARKTKAGLTGVERRELRQIRQALVESGLPKRQVERKMIYYRRVISDNLQKRNSVLFW